MIIKPTRRKFLSGLAALVAAPAIIRVADLMPVKAWAVPIEPSVSELIIVNRTLSESERTAIGDYFVAKWGAFNDLDGIIPCKDGDSVALLIVDGQAFSQPIPSLRPTFSIPPQT